MNKNKQKKLEAAGWKVGSAADFLGLSEAEETIVEMKLALADQIKVLRKEAGVTQVQLAKGIGSSQSRVAKLEAADGSSSLEKYVSAMVHLGGDQKTIATVIGSSSSSSAKKKPARKTSTRKVARKAATKRARVRG